LSLPSHDSTKAAEEFCCLQILDCDYSRHSEILADASEFVACKTSARQTSPYLGLDYAILHLPTDEKWCRRGLLLVQRHVSTTAQFLNKQKKLQFKAVQ